MSQRYMKVLSEGWDIVLRLGMHLRISWGAVKPLRNSGLRWERGEGRGEQGEGMEMYKLPVMKTVTGM